MSKVNLLIVACMVWLHGPALLAQTDYYAEFPFGSGYRKAKDSDNLATGKWWELEGEEEAAGREWIQSRPREQTLAFALYTHDNGILKLNAQCFPLLPEEPKSVILDFQINGEWVQQDKQPVLYPGWDVHFRITDWDASRDVPYRLRLGNLSTFEGLIRKDPVDKETIVVASMSCNSPRDRERFLRTELVENLKQHDPDLLFFAGDQNYTHDEATYGWLQFGVQYAELMQDRPTVCIPDDHDVGHGNLWGEEGLHNPQANSSAPGYAFPASFVNMVQRQQTGHLPDPYDPTPVKQGITVYYTDLTVGGISFAILEDRKFKSGPQNIPKMRPRQDHINDPDYDRSAIDLPGLKLLGDRQLEFLDSWARNWDGAEMKVALSQTAFCGAVHLHGGKKNRLLADLDCNGWPQSGRNRALRVIRAARAIHLCGDQHLAAVVKHGIDHFGDGPYAFTSPALVNTIYGRWWWPLDEKPGAGAEKISSTLPWVGDYEDGLGNKITMLAYANPQYSTNQQLRNDSSRENRGDGYALVRLNKTNGTAVFECWPRFADLSEGDKAQFEGWPVQVSFTENDGRQPVGYLETVSLPVENAVIELTNDETGELVYCYRVPGSKFKAPVFTAGKYTLKAGSDQGDTVLLEAAFPEK